MFSAFIVDDDKVSVEVTYMLFPWSELNVTQINKIYTPTGLVEKILSESPDIVFIDIEMGDMSGLEIMKECIEAGSKAYFIIISGHDNFDYAHTAVNLGALYYLLKPIDKKDIDAVVVKLKTALKVPQHDDLSGYLASAKSFNNYVVQKLQNKTYRFIISSLEEFLYKGLEYILSNCIFASHIIGENKHMLIITADSLTDDILNKLDEFTRKSKIVCAVSHIFSKEDNLYEYFQQANQLSYHQFINPSGKLLIGPVNSDTTVLKNILDNIFLAIDEKNTAEIKRNISALPQLFLQENYTMTHVVWLYNALIGRINIVLNKSSTFSLSQMDEEDLHVYFTNFSNLCLALYNSIVEHLETEQIAENNTNQLWEKVLLFIENNYSEKLQVQDICKNLFISERTFYYLFKANVKVTFVEYLTEFRIKKAKILLLTTNLPIPEVAEKVGIKDHYYFNKVFKKYTGMTPVKFRAEEGYLTDEQETKD